ncbi:hypothetical protein Scep_001046 [Stephania cephalantha]|uniref:Cytochrome P450 n=1 Tax=Stephania cephalantha TaxID=152367 RepID=A0AAP0L9Z3_9MAGN
MDLLTYIFFAFLFIHIFKHIFNILTQKNHPPSPFAVPIIGHLHLLKPPLHKTLTSLSHHHGPVLHLKLGLRNALVLSSPSAIEEFFNTNDIVFANRPHALAGLHLGYNYTSLPWTPYGHHWRTLKRVTTINIFSSHSLSLSSRIRNEEIKHLVERLNVGFDESRAFKKLDLKSVFLELMFNVMMRFSTGKRFFEVGMDGDEKKRLIDTLTKILVPNTKMGLGDFFPLLTWFKFLKLDQKLIDLHKKRDDFLQSLINKHRNHDPSISTNDTTLMGTLLSLQKSEPEYYTEDILKGIISMMFTAGTDTTALTMEWAMSLLLNHPEVMAKAREEIDSKLQRKNILEESDLANLPYLTCIVNEALRLYPPGPLLVPHASSAECTVGGYRVPKGTIVMGNAWAIHRDPRLWEDPTEFRPERFAAGGEGHLGHGGYKFVPFGVGRRGCPGAGMAVRVAGLGLGALIQGFEWERVGGELVDMSEGSGSPTMSKLRPLEAMYRPRSL